jgi:hypothetical protein
MTKDTDIIWLAVLLLFAALGYLIYKLDDRFDLRLRRIRNKRLRAQSDNPAWIRAEKARWTQERRRQAREQKRVSNEVRRQQSRDERWREKSRLRDERRGDRHNRI